MDDKTLTIESGVIIPILQAIISGVLIGLLVLSAWGLNNRFTGWGVLFFGLSLGAFGSWVIAVRRWYAWGDGAHGIYSPEPTEPTEPNEPFKIEITTEDWDSSYERLKSYPRGAYIETPINEDHLIKACQVINAGGNFSYASLAGPYKPLSRAEFEALREAFIKSGLAYWKTERGHTHGLALTAVGRIVVKRIAALNPSPTITRSP